MMKKEYMNPEMEIVDIKMNQLLLAGSDLGFGGDVDDANDAEAPELPGMPDIPGAPAFPWDM